MVLAGLDFAGLLAIHKMFTGMHFYASFERLLALLAGAVALWHFGIAHLFKKKE